MPFCRPNPSWSSPGSSHLNKEPVHCQHWRNIPKYIMTRRACISHCQALSRSSLSPQLQWVSLKLPGTCSACLAQKCPTEEGGGAVTLKRGFFPWRQLMYPALWCPHCHVHEEESEYKASTLAPWRRASTSARKLVRLLVGALHIPDMARGKAAYAERLGQTQVRFQIAPFFSRPWFCFLHRVPGIWKLICMPSMRPERVAALKGLLPAQRMDGDGAAYNLTHDPGPVPLGTSQATVGFRAFLGYYRLPDR